MGDTSKRGFASMTPAERKRIASMGGKAGGRAKKSRRSS
jgi:hypothetical protein